MLKKALIVAALLTIGASGLVASNWSGTFDGDISGTWAGTLSPYVDPPFWGTWEVASPTDPPPHGYMRGETIELVGNYYVVTGSILDKGYNVIGKWEGTFPAVNDELAKGTWTLESGETGKWSGWSI